MSKYDFNQFRKHNRPQSGDAFYHIVMAMLIALNGMFVGGAIHNGANLAKGGYDGDTAAAVLIYLLCAAYSGRTAYQLYQVKKSIDQNQKQR